MSIMIVTNKSKIEYKINLSSIDYDQVQAQLQFLQDQSLSFLKTNL